MVNVRTGYVASNRTGTETRLPVHLRVSVGPAVPFSVDRLGLASVIDCVAQAFASTAVALAFESL